MEQFSAAVNTDFMVVTEAAQNHFRDLLQKEDQAGMNLRVFVANPGTAFAEVSVTFCPLGEEEPTDIPFRFANYTLFVESASQAVLEQANIDFIEDKVGGQLSIKAPFLKGRAPLGDSSLRERIQYVIDSEINPNLAGHGGNISIVDIVDEKIVVLQFGGGCHGCGMSSITLKHGIQKTLKEKFPEILEIRDITDHTTGKDPYC